MIRVLSKVEVAEADRELANFCKEYNCNMGNIKDNIMGIAMQEVDKALAYAVKIKKFRLHGVDYAVVRIKGGLHDVV